MIKFVSPWTEVDTSIMPIDTEIYYANIIRIYFEIRLKLIFGIKIIFPVLSPDLFPYLWAELASEQALFIGGMACKKRKTENYCKLCFRNFSILNSDFLCQRHQPLNHLNFRKLCDFCDDVSI